MLQAYLDDSGSHDGAPVSVIAGYFGGHRRWVDFESRWKEVLVKYQVTEFHAQYFWQRNRDPRRTPKPGRNYNQFDGWPEDKANNFLDELLTIIEESDRIYPFASGVVGSEWQKQTIDDRRLLTGASSLFPSGKPSKSIFLAFQRVVYRTATYCKPGVKIHYFIDDDKQQNTAWATICYGEMKRLLRKAKDDLYPTLGELTPADSAVAVPLQAADLLAYEAKLYAEKCAETGDTNAPMRPSHLRAIMNMRSIDDFWLFDAPRFDTLQKMRQQIEARFHEQES